MSFVRTGAEQEAAAPQPARPSAPGREQIALLEPFEGLDLGHIVVVADALQAESALAELMTLSVVGFDTESRPTFLKDQKSEGPHVVQFATLQKAWIFQLHLPESFAVVGTLLQAASLQKVGFGLSGDRSQILHKFGKKPNALLDLNERYRRLGYVKEIGVKVAIALAFNQRFRKSKKATTSNWANHRLSDAQILYAANDAYAAIRVHYALEAMAAAPV